MSIRPYIQRELDKTDADLRRLQSKWPAECTLDSGLRSVYHFLPYFFLEAFPQLEPPALHRLALFGRLMAGSIFLQDRIIDGRSPAAAAELTLRVSAMQYEAYDALRTEIKPEAKFWSRCRDYCADYTAATLEERRFATGERPWSEYSEAIGKRVAIGKNAVSRTVLAGVVELATDDRLLDQLIQSVDAFNLAGQLWDDLQDWKEDLFELRVPSILLRRLVSEPPPELGDQERAARTRELARELYYGGHARHVIDLALASLDQAEPLIDRVPELAWHDTTNIYRRRFESLARDIERITRANLTRARAARTLDLKPPSVGTAAEESSWKALRFLQRQWELGFGEARDQMQYPKELRLSPPNRVTTYCGDVFQRALIVDALCDAKTLAGDQLEDLLKAEIDYLLGQRLTTASGGWSYFPNLLGLPPDADDLAQIMLAMLRTGNRHLLTHCERPLSIVLTDNRHADGSFETWIIPDEGRTEVEERYPGFVETVWEAGPDPEVMANLLYALSLYDQERFAEDIRTGTDFIENRQSDDGRWDCRWYRGPFYGLFVCLRLFAVVRPQAPAIGRALAFVRTAQRDDGGFGLDEERSDALSTALALLALVHGPADWQEDADSARAERAQSFLERSQRFDGCWPLQPLIFKGCGAFHGSRTLTTAFALKAAVLARQARPADASAPAPPLQVATRSAR